MGAVSFANPVFGVSGAYRSVEVDVTFSSSYATGGDTVSLANLGLRHVDDMHALGSVTHSPLSASTSGKISGVGIQPVLAGTAVVPLLKSTVNGAESANATNLSALGAVRVEFRGH